MYIFYSSAQLQNFLNHESNKGSLGFVPTMGALHSGHLAIVEQSLREHEKTIVSIYVNPTQFNQKEDFEKYPNTLQQDIERLSQIKTDILFLPSESDIYPNGVAAAQQEQIGFLDTIMEGKFRPGHFKGVKAVIRSFLKIIQPNTIYLGQKDFQQVLVVQQLINESQIKVQLEVFPTVREADGLAMSSRNMRLSEQERKVAAQLFQIMLQSVMRLKNEEVAQVKNWAWQQLSELPDVRPEYFEFADSSTLQLLDNITPQQKSVLCISAWVGKVRLIDNLIL